MKYKIEELAAAVLDRSEEYWDGDYIFFDDPLEAEFGVNLEQFGRIAKALVTFFNGQSKMKHDCGKCPNCGGTGDDDLSKAVQALLKEYSRVSKGHDDDLGGMLGQILSDTDGKRYVVIVSEEDDIEGFLNGFIQPERFAGNN